MLFKLNITIERFYEDNNGNDMKWITYCCKCGDYDISYKCDCGHIECDDCGDWICGLRERSEITTSCELAHIDNSKLAFKQCDDLYLTICNDENQHSSLMAMKFADGCFDADEKEVHHSDRFELKIGLTTGKPKQFMIIPLIKDGDYREVYIGSAQWKRLVSIKRAVDYVKEYHDLSGPYLDWDDGMKILVRMYMTGNLID
jgi:hypothetical protein